MEPDRLPARHHQVSRQPGKVAECARRQRGVHPLVMLLRGEPPVAKRGVQHGRLLAQRVVLLHGPLDDLSVTRVAAELMTLDAEGDDAVSLRVDCGEADFRASAGCDES